MQLVTPGAFVRLAAALAVTFHNALEQILSLTLTLTCIVMRFNIGTKNTIFLTSSSICVHVKRTHSYQYKSLADIQKHLQKTRRHTKGVQPALLSSCERDTNPHYVSITNDTEHCSDTQMCEKQGLHSFSIASINCAS